MHVPFLAKLRVNGVHDVAGNGESQSLAAAGLGKDERVDAHHAALRIDQRTAAVAGIDGRVGLDVRQKIVGMELARGGTDDTHADRSFQAPRVSKGHHQLALTDRVGVAERKMRKTGAIDFDDRHVHLAIQPDQLGLQQLHFRLEVAARPVLRATESRTWMRLAPWTTCALVTMKPSSERMIPEPVLRCLESSAAVLLESDSSAVT